MCTKMLIKMCKYGFKIFSQINLVIIDVMLNEQDYSPKLHLTLWAQWQSESLQGQWWCMLNQKGYSNQYMYYSYSMALSYCILQVEH